MPVIDGGREPLLKLASQSDPSQTDDSSIGYTIGSLWYNSNSQVTFQCVKDAAGSAVWAPLRLDGVQVYDTTGSQTVSANSSVEIDFNSYDVNTNTNVFDFESPNYLHVYYPGIYRITGGTSLQSSGSTTQGLVYLYDAGAANPVRGTYRYMECTSTGYFASGSFDIIIEIASATHFSLVASETANKANLRTAADSSYLGIQRVG